MIVLTAISIASAFVGLVVAGVPGVIVGLIIAVVEFVVGVYAIGKVREIARGGDR